MSNVIGAGALVLTADSKDLEAKLHKSRQKIQAFSVQLSKGVSMLSSSPAAAAGRLFLDAFKGIDEKNEKILNLSRTFGQSVDDMSRLANVAKLGGVEIDTVGKGLKAVSQILGTLDTAETQENLASIGIKPEDLQNMDALEGLDLFTKKFGEIEDAAESTTKKIKIFGKSALDIDPLLQGGSLRDQMKGVPGYSTAQAERIDAAGDAVAKLEMEFENLSIQLAAELGPAIADLVNFIAGNVGPTKTFVGKMQDNLARGMAFGLDMIMEPRVETWNSAINEQFADDERAKTVKSTSNSSAKARKIASKNLATFLAELDDKGSGDPIAKLVREGKLGPGEERVARAKLLESKQSTYLNHLQDAAKTAGMFPDQIEEVNSGMNLAGDAAKKMAAELKDATQRITESMTLQVQRGPGETLERQIRGLMDNKNLSERQRNLSLAGLIGTPQAPRLSVATDYGSVEAARNILGNSAQNRPADGAEAVKQKIEELKRVEEQAMKYGEQMAGYLKSLDGKIKGAF